MKKLMMAALLLSSSPALATGTPQPGPTETPGTPDTGTPTPSPAPSGDTGSSGGQGGAGGNGSGGNAAANAQATGIGVGSASLRSSIRSSNRNSNSASGGVATSTSGATGGSVGNLTTGPSSATSDSSTNGSGNSAVIIEGDRFRRIPVSTAYAAPLAAGLDTCLGSMSGGVQTGVFGISLGGTKHDRTCELIKLGREAGFMGMADVQCQVLAQDKRFALALERAGRACALPVSAAVMVPAESEPFYDEETLRRGERG